jgi:hypothetical protein
MHEEPELNSDPLTEKLGRFTPDLSGLDRDALLFQAGRASAGRQRRLWPALAGLLALSQAATLLFFLTRVTESSPTVVVIRTDPGGSAAVKDSPPDSPQEPSQWSYRRAVMTGDIDDLPPLKRDEASVTPPHVLTVLSTANLPPIE